MRTRNLGTCTTAGCDKPAKTRELCNRHYLQWWQSTPKNSRPDPVPLAREPLSDRIMRQAQRQPSGCLHWTGRINTFGYGQIKVGRKTRMAHVISYETFVGPVPEGFDVDHVCHGLDSTCPGGDTCPHRRCVEPAHLEAVTRIINVLRSRGFSAVNAVKTHCKNGHPFDEANTITRYGRRACRACRRAIEDRANERLRLATVERKAGRTHCKNGHPWVPERIYVDPKGWQYCRDCTAEHQSKYRQRKRSAPA